MKKKKALCLASMASNLDNFNRNNVKLLQELGYDVTLASNFCTSEDSSSQNKINSFRKEMKRDGVHTVQIDFSRRIVNVKKQIKSIKQVNKLLANNYDLIHCHTPICAAITRLCAMKYQKKGKVKVIYTAHGFHFFKGAPIKNWILYYPVEKWLSRYTDVLITINKEDYRRAKKYFRAKKTEYVPGVGVDTKKFAPRQSGREKIRKELNLSDNQIMLLSVGELNENKNHISVIKAIKDTDYVYVIVGKGDKKAELECTAKDYNVDLRLMGYRSDVSDFYDAADVYVLSSMREGLNVSLMEAMASSMPIACSDIRGNTDLINEVVFNPNNTNEIKSAIKIAIDNKDDLGRRNKKKIKAFDISKVNEIVDEIYRGGYEHLIELAKQQQKRVEIGIPVDCKMMISVGEISCRKNHRIVIKALNAINDSDVYYVVVGKGKLADKLMALDRTERVCLLNYRTDIVELLHTSDLFIFPSIQEGLPIALLEAMAAGLTCAASRIRGNIDLLKDRADLLFDPLNIDETKNVVLSLIEDNNGMDQRNMIIVRKGFSIEIVNKKMSNLYCELN